MKKILIMESRQEDVEIAKEYLELAGFAVTASMDWLEGERMALSGGFALLLLGDAPIGQDAADFCRRFRQKHLEPVIFISEKTEDLDVIHGLGSGADDYVVKPFRPGVLVARVKAHMSRYAELSAFAVARQTGSRVIEAGDLRIDKSSHRAFVDDREIRLTPKEFDLLYFMAGHPNRVYSKEDLFEQIWGVGPIGDKATVTVHIKKIREKIEKDPHNPKYIETLWGSGYRFRSN